MRLALRHGSRMVADLALFSVRSGRLWVPVVIAALIVMALLVVAAQAAVPVAVYTLL